MGRRRRRKPLCAFSQAGLSQCLIGQKNQDIKMIDWGWGVSFTQSTRVKCMLSSGTHTHPHFPQMYIKPKSLLLCRMHSVWRATTININNSGSKLAGATTIIWGATTARGVSCSSPVSLTTGRCIFYLDSEPLSVFKCSILINLQCQCIPVYISPEI